MPATWDDVNKKMAEMKITGWSITDSVKRSDCSFTWHQRQELLAETLHKNLKIEIKVFIDFRQFVVYVPSSVHSFDSLVVAKSCISYRGHLLEGGMDCNAE